MSRKIKQQITAFLYIIGFLGILLAVFFGANNLARTRENLTETKANVARLQSAIDEINARTDQNGRLIICMLQVPISQRTTEVQENCRKQADVDIKESKTAQSSSSKVSQPTTSQVQIGQGTTPTNNQQQGNNNTPTPTPEPEKKTILDRTVDGINNTVDSILNVIGL